MLAQLHDGYEALRESYDAQRRFVSDASHELRTPLTTIRANLDLLRREPPIAKADRRDVLGDLASESERLSRLVANLLTLARSDAGRPLRREPVRLEPLLTRIVRRLAATQPGRSIGIEVPPNATALGDPDALTQVLLILLDNALKFTPTGGTVSVAAEVTDTRVLLVVHDTGMGMAPEVLPHVFERFYQGHSGMRGTTGSGLGLAIAHALVTGQGGTIAVESQLGQDSTFTITLPRFVDGPELDRT
jgi:signal transduction histidine kinase